MKTENQKSEVVNGFEAQDGSITPEDVDQNQTSEVTRSFQVEYSINEEIKTVVFQAINEIDAINQLDKSGTEFDFVISFAIKSSENVKKFNVKITNQVTGKVQIHELPITKEFLQWCSKKDISMIAVLRHFERTLDYPFAMQVL